MLSGDKGVQGSGIVVTLDLDGDACIVGPLLEIPDFAGSDRASSLREIDQPTLTSFWQTRGLPAIRKEQGSSVFWRSRNTKPAVSSLGA